MLSENVILDKAYSDNIRSGFLVPYEKSRFLISFSNSIRSGLTRVFLHKDRYETFDGKMFVRKPCRKI